MKQYLGDGVYAEYNDYRIVLTTEDGQEVTNKIVLEPTVYMALVEFVKTTLNIEDASNIGIV